MKASELLRQAAPKYEQLFDEYWREDENGNVCAACAFAAIYFEITDVRPVRDPIEDTTFQMEMSPALIAAGIPLGMDTPFPPHGYKALFDRKEKLVSLIFRLNDKEHQSFAEIADVLEGIGQ